MPRAAPCRHGQALMICISCHFFARFLPRRTRSKLAARAKRRRARRSSIARSGLHISESASSQAQQHSVTVEVDSALHCKPVRAASQATSRCLTLCLEDLEPAPCHSLVHKFTRMRSTFVSGPTLCPHSALPSPRNQHRGQLSSRPSSAPLTHTQSTPPGDCLQYVRLAVQPVWSSICPLKVVQLRYQALAAQQREQSMWVSQKGTLA